MNSLENYNFLKKNINSNLEVFINEEKNEKIKNIIEYTFKNGKRIRPIICNIIFKKFLENNKIINNNNNEIAYSTLIPEIIHNLSLIIDDLPCMDDDNYRRNNESVHFKFGIIPSYITILKIINNILIKFIGKIKPQQKIHFRFINGNIELLSFRDFLNDLIFKNIEDLIDGQYYDLSLIKLDLDIEILYKINSKKTSPLFCLSFILGYIQIFFLDKEFLFEEKIINELCTIGEIFGLIFQLNDDIIDREKDKKEGKILNICLCLGYQESIEIFDSKCREFKKKLFDLKLWNSDFEEILVLLKNRIK